MGGGRFLGCGGWGEEQGGVSAERPGPQGGPVVLRLWERRGCHVVSRGLGAQMDGPLCTSACLRFAGAAGRSTTGWVG